MEHRRKPTRRFVFWAILITVTAFACELGGRLAFALLIDSKILFYGTPLYRKDIKRLPSAIMAKIGYTPPTPAGYQPTVREPSYTKFAPHEVKTDKDENGNRFHPSINSRGFRGGEFDDRKQPGIIRVVTLGASSTFGYHNRDDQTYPYYLDGLLNSVVPEPRFEVINLGIPHMRSEEIVALFVKEGVTLHPDIVTFYEGWNDATRAVEAMHGRKPLDTQDGAGSMLREAYRVAAELSLLAALFDSLSYYAAEIEVSDDDLEHVIQESAARFLANLSAIHAVCQRQSIWFVPATQQARSQSIAREAIKGITFQQELRFVGDKLASTGKLTRREAAFLIHAGLMQALREWAARNQVSLADGIGATDSDRSVLLTYIHANSSGNRMIAREFARSLSELPGGLSSTDQAADGAGRLRRSDLFRSETEKPTQLDRAMVRAVR